MQAWRTLIDDNNKLSVEVVRKFALSPVTKANKKTYMLTCAEPIAKRKITFYSVYTYYIYFLEGGSFPFYFLSPHHSYYQPIRL